MGIISGTGGVRIPVKVSHAGVNRHRELMHGRGCVSSSLSSHRSAMRRSSAALRPDRGGRGAFHVIANWQRGPRSGVTRSEPARNAVVRAQQLRKMATVILTTIYIDDNLST